MVIQSSRRHLKNTNAFFHPSFQTPAEPHLSKTLQTRTLVSSLHFPQFLRHFSTARQAPETVKSCQNRVIFQGRIHTTNIPPLTSSMAGTLTLTTKTLWSCCTNRNCFLVLKARHTLPDKPAKPVSPHVFYSVLYLCNGGIFMCISATIFMWGRQTTWRIHSSNFRSIVYFVLLLDSFYPEFFTDHSERANTLSSAAFFELFSSEIIFVCLISCRGILCYSARWNSSKDKGYGP